MSYNHPYLISVDKYWKPSESNTQKIIQKLNNLSHFELGAIAFFKPCRTKSMVPIFVFSIKYSFEWFSLEGSGLTTNYY